MWYGRVDIDIHFSDFSFFGIGMCLDLMSWVQQVHNAAIVARSLGCQCDSDTEMPTGRTLSDVRRRPECWLGGDDGAGGAGRTPESQIRDGGASGAAAG